MPFGCTYVAFQSFIIMYSNVEISPDDPKDMYRVDAGIQYFNGSVSA